MNEVEKKWLSSGRFEYLAETPCGEDIVAMESLEGSIYVATTKRIYRLEGKELREVALIGLPVIDPDLLGKKE